MSALAWQPACAHALFEARVARAPDAVAVTFEDVSLTYRELDQRANALAHHLLDLGVRPEDRVALALERTPEWVVGLLAILKAGGAYVPLDVAYPRARLEHVLASARPRVVLTARALLERLPPLLAPTVCLDELREALARKPVEAPRVAVAPEHLAYVIFTSGSTGRPKGTLLAHQGLSHVLRAVVDAHQVGPSSRVLAFASPGFDASVCEVLSTLVAGGCLCLASREASLPGPALHALLRSRGITAVTLVPSVLAQVEPEGLPALETVISAGEALPPELARRWKPGRRLLNAYGPTEATICATVDDDVDVERPSIGRPLPGVRVRVLDAHGLPVREGDAGELYVGGAGLARGYLERPDLTAERFVPDALGEEPGARLYRTGDRVRALPDGRLEFLGRVDQQVKVRGVRIELGEVEAVLAQHPGVRLSAVVLQGQGPGDARLVAYVVPTAQEGLAPPTPEDLRAFLRDRLPEPMLPATYVVLASLPLTAHGKLDRQALPAPVAPELTDSTPPRTPREARVARLWAELFHREQVGIHEDFFALGGHSLLAGRLIARLRESDAVDVPLAALFEHPTVARLSAFLETRSGGIPSLPPISRAPRDGALPLSFQQEQVWFLHELAPGNLAYNAQMVLRLHGPLDVAALERSLEEIIRRHESFRTTFPSRDGRPVQEIHAPWPVHLPVVDLSAEAEPEGAAKRRIAEDVRRPFNPTRLPLLRWTLLKLGPEAHVLLHVEHHYVHDGWSAAVFLRELKALYPALLAGQPSPLPEPRIQFADFAAWQRQWLQGSVLEAQLAFWRRTLDPLPPPVELPADRPRPRVQSFRGGELRTEVPEPLRRSLKALCREQGVTFFMALRAAFVALMHRYTGLTDVCIATTVANRRAPEAEGLIGMMVNTVLLRTDAGGDPAFTELLRRVRAVDLEAHAHADVPLMTLVRALQPERDASHPPLFQVMFSFHDSPVPEVAFGGLRGTTVPVGNGSSKCDLNIIVIPEGEQRAGTGAPEDGPVAIRWEYSADLFDADTIARLSAHYHRLLEAVATAPGMRLSSLPLLSDEERHRVLVAWNDTHAGERPHVGPHSAFEAQAQRTPEAVAVVHGSQSLTYAELDRRANQLARHLARWGVGPEVRVGLCVERSVEMVVGLLGILKAGGAYVPLDPGFPPERLAFMLHDAGMPVLVTQQALRARLSVGPVRTVCLDADAPAIASEGATPLHREVTPEAAAYVLYTSGSTGRPKGVQVPHGAVARFLDAMRERPGLSASDVLVAVTTLSFDIAVLELFLPLSVGARVVVAGREEATDGARLAGLLETSGATVLQATPSTWRLLLESGWQGRRMKALSGGEALPRELATTLHARCGAVWNLYGPTETTVWSTVHEVSAEDGPVSIGRPIAGTRVYVLDAGLHPVPVGVPGELFIGGEGVARGYLGRPELTAERFMPDAFGAAHGARLYRTGDLVRWRTNGTLEYLGRADQQVKLRGHRIEPGEIEAALRQHPAVHEAVVVVREDTPGDKRLVAYVVPSGEGTPPALTATDLRPWLQQRLPEYMVPSAYVVLPALPLTPNGKVNRGALPAPGRDALGTAPTYVAPRTPEEARLAALWAELLGLERVGTQDDFFSLGGHSLLAARLVARVRAELSAELAVRTVFDHPTVALLAEALLAARARPPETDVIRRAEPPMNPAQLSDDEVNALLGIDDL